MLEILENKLKDKSWTEQQDQEFIKVLEDLGKAVHNLGVRTYIMAESIDAFYQNMVELFDEDENSATSIPENGNVYPESNTNSSPVSPE
jgi:type IV secretory pathway VirB4 component